MNCDKLVRFFRLSLREKKLIFESTIILLGTWCLVKFVPFRWWSHYLGEKIDPSISIALPDGENKTLSEIRNAILRINRVFGGSFTCLMQAIAGKIMLNRRHIPNVLVLGVNMQPDTVTNQLIMKAHAWLKSSFVILLGGEAYLDYSVVAQFYSNPKHKS